MKKIKSFNELPESYVQRFIFDPKNNRKQLIWFNLGSIGLFIPFIIIIGFIKSELIFDLYNLLLFIVLSIVVIIIHELIHALFFRLGTRKQIKFGFHGFAASAGAPNVYYYKWYYLIIGIAPAVILNLILLITCFLIKDKYFFAIYLTLAFHFSGCIGDFYIVFKLLRLRNTTLIEDKGILIKFFGKE